MEEEKKWDHTYSASKNDQKWPGHSSAGVTYRSFKTGNYFSERGRFDSVLLDTAQRFKVSDCVKEKNPKYHEIMAKLKDPSLIAEKHARASIKPDMTLLKKKLNDNSSRRIDKEIQKNKITNLGIPIVSVHNLKEYQRNKISDILK